LAQAPRAQLTHFLILCFEAATRYPLPQPAQLRPFRRAASMVFLPGPAIPALPGPPSSFALRMRPWLLAVFSLFLPVALARFLVLDVIGACFLILTAGIGWYAVKGGMDITWLLCLAVILFLNAIFDAFILIVRLLRTDFPLFGKSLPWQMNFVHGVLFVGPIVELVGACICWKIYREHLANILAEDGMIGEIDQGGYGAAAPAGMNMGPGGVGSGAGGQVGRGSQQMGSTLGSAGARGSRIDPPGGSRMSFEAFHGTGHRLQD